MMRRAPVVLVVSIALAWPLALFGIAPAEEERTELVHLLAFGAATAAPDALVRVASAPLASLQDSLAAARLRLATDTALRTQVRGKAWREVFGPQPTQPVDDTMDAGALHFELRQHYFNLLARDADAQARAVDLAYRLVVQRPARAQEIAYWHQHGPLPFIVLVGCVENWARRNQPGLMATSGTPTVSPNSTWLVSVRVSPSLAQEVWSMMTREADAEARGEPPRVLAPGAGQVATDGNMFLFLASDERVDQTGRRTTGLRH